MEKKLITTLIWAVLILSITATTARADYIAGSSAAIKKDNILSKEPASNPTFTKRMAIKAVLQNYNSPLVDSIDSFIDKCQKYDLDCYLLPSIAGVESFFGKFLIPQTYNPFGWDAGRMYFKNWDEAMETVASSLRKNYINKGADTVEKIGPIYATTFTWAPKVRHFMQKFEEEEKKYHLFLNNNKVEL